MPLSRAINLSPGLRGEVSTRHPVLRNGENPILTCHDVNLAWQDPALAVVTVHNAGVTHFDGHTLLLFRSHLRCGVSVIGLARSRNGIDDWQVDRHPFLVPARPDDEFGDSAPRDEIVEAESGGVEDARVTKIGATYAITYSAYHGRLRNRVRVHLATTDDFHTVVRWGPLLRLDMRNVVLFPRPFHNGFAALFRPNDLTMGEVGGIYAEIRLGYADDWRRGPWKIQEAPLMRTGHGPSAFADKIGPGAPPVETPHGWLNLFHGVRSTMDGNPYVLGIALHDKENPARVKMCSLPVLFPSAVDCRVRPDDYVHVPNVVFSCGMARRSAGTVLIYYGGNDTVMNVAASHEDVLAELCTDYGQDPLTGTLQYQIRAHPVHI